MSNQQLKTDRKLGPPSPLPQMAKSMEPISQSPSTLSPPVKKPTQRDLLTHLEIYLAKRDGIDKLLKILRYTSKLLLNTPPLLPPSHPLHPRVKSFESSLALSRKAFRLGKFIQDLNSLRSSSRSPHVPIFLLSLLAYGGEGIYYFIEQIVWLHKTGLVSLERVKLVQKISAWAEMLGYVGSVGLKLNEIKVLGEEARCLDGVVEVAGEGCEEVREKRREKEVKIVMKKVSVIQDVADGLMALADIRDGFGRLSHPLVVSLAGLLSAVISAHKNWVSC